MITAQKLARLLMALEKSLPVLKHFENQLASSLSSDSRSHDPDREARQALVELIAATEDVTGMQVDP